MSLTHRSELPGRRLTAAVPRSALVALATVVGLVVIGMPSVAAAEESDPTFTTAPAAPEESAATPATDIGPTMVVLDASGSMTEADAGGQPRMDAAKSATTGLLDELGEDAPVGLLTYGTGTGNTPDDKAAGCRDVSLLRGPQSGDLAALKSQVTDLTPRGYTPIGQALRTAANALPDDGPRTVVLVSDGIDTCAPPPVCEVAKELKDKGVDLVVNTVGLLVDDEARTELSCIADATGGTYADATDAASLGEQMRRAATRTYDAYTSGIADLRGTDTAADAPEIPKGEDVGERFGAVNEGFNQVTFRTDLASETSAGTEESEQYWRVPVTDGERVAVAVNTTQPPAVDTMNLGQQDINVHLAPVEDPESDDCANKLLTDSSNSRPTGVVTEEAASTAVGSDRCDTRELLVSVTRGGDWKKGEDVPAEVTVTRIGAVADAGDPAGPGRVGDDPEKMPMPATSHPVTPGTWYDSAAELQADGADAVEATIVPGEQKFFRVPVGYGQGLDTVMQVTDAPESGKFSIGDELTLTERNGARQSVFPAGTAETGGGLDVHAKESRWDSFAAPVTFGNRFGGQYGNGESTAGIGSTWLGGDQYIVVTLERSFADTQIDENSRQVPVTFRLAAKTTGTATDGPDIAPLTWPGDASATETAAPADGTEAASEASDGDDGGVPWTLVGIVAAVVVVLGAGGAVLLHRR